MSSILKALKQLEISEQKSESQTLYLLDPRKVIQNHIKKAWLRKRVSLLLFLTAFFSLSYLIFHFSKPITQIMFTLSNSLTMPQLLKSGTNPSTLKTLSRNQSEKPLIPHPDRSKDTGVVTSAKDNLEKISKKDSIVTANSKQMEIELPQKNTENLQPKEDKKSVPKKNLIPLEKTSSWNKKIIENNESSEKTIDPLFIDPSFKPPKLSLQAIAYSNDVKRSIAVIDDHIMRAGDYINGAIIFKILENSVIMKEGSNKWEIRLGNRP